MVQTSNETLACPCALHNTFRHILAHFLYPALSGRRPWISTEYPVILSGPMPSLDQRRCGGDTCGDARRHLRRRAHHDDRLPQVCSLYLAAVGGCHGRGALRGAVARRWRRCGGARCLLRAEPHTVGHLDARAKRAEEKIGCGNVTWIGLKVAEMFAFRNRP